jgi:AraC family transcriptional regulator
MSKLQIKNMVCPRCIMAVERILEELDIESLEVRLGEVILAKELSEKKKSELEKELNLIGFELLDDRNSQIIHQIKTLLIQAVQEPKDEELNLSNLISQELNKDYSQLSKLFSATTGITIEQFYIQQKIEKVKELLIYDELSLKEIAFQLNYSSTAHLSNQFKKITGFTPTEFKSLAQKERKGIDGIG